MGSIVAEQKDAKIADLEHVLDAWSSEPSSRQRYDRLRLERRDGESLEVLIDAETARDLGDKLTITAARARARSRGPAISPADSSVDPGGAEDMARARKVFDLAGFAHTTTGFQGQYDDDALRVLAEEFRASREDVKKAHGMIDEAQARVRMLLSTQMQLEAELESVKADRAKLIAEAAKRDVGESSIDLSDPSEPAPS
jgi:hypothetical protein